PVTENGTPRTRLAVIWQQCRRTARRSFPSAEREGRRRPPVVEPIVVPQQPRAADHAQRNVAEPGTCAGEVVTLSIAARQTLHLGGAHAAYRAVGPQRRGGIV